MAKLKNLEVQYVENYKQIHNSLNVNNLFNVKKLYVILDDLDILKQESVWPEINTNGNILIFKYNTLDKRNKFYKYFQNNLVEFNKLSDEVLSDYIFQEVPLNPANCKTLINICGNNYNQILLELDKVKNYLHYYANINELDMVEVNSIFSLLKSKGVFHKEVADITFEFVDKVACRDIVQIYKLEKELSQIEESNIKLLSLLYNKFKVILLIQSCKSNDIAKTTGLPAAQIYYNKDKIGYYSIGELVRILKLIQKTEEGIKTGLIDEANSLNYILVNIL